MRARQRWVVGFFGLLSASSEAREAPPHPKGAASPAAVHDKPPAAAAPVRHKAPPSPPELLFTFDDGPHLERTPRVLKVLDEHHIKAVFFVNGVHFQGKSASAEKSRALMRQVVAHGHAIGNHTVNHLFLCNARGSKVAATEILENARLIEEAIGRAPELYRTPYGAHCKTLSDTLARLHIKHIGWDIDPQDWKVQNTAKVRDFIEKWLHNMKSGREILLMHDVHEDTVEALPQILDWLDKENAERGRLGVPKIRVIDYSYLLPPHPALPPLLEGLGRVLIDHLGGQPAARVLWLLTPGAPRS